MQTSRHRIVMTGLSVALAVLIALVITFYPSGNHSALPAPLESVRPAPGDVVVAQAEVVIEMPTGYELSLVVDGVPIPAAEVYAVDATGTFRWRPGPASVIAAFEPGEHTVEVSWDRRAGTRPDPGAFAWTFRVT